MYLRPSLAASVAGALLLVLAMSAAPAAAQNTPVPERERPDSLTVMTYNVLYATPDAGTIRAIEAADPDLVGLQEISEPRLRYIARELGYYFHHHGAHEASRENDTGILSRYPIAQVTRYGATIYLTVDDPIHIANVHLSPYPYEPYQLRDDEITRDEAVEQARFTRYPEIQPVLEALQDPLSKGIPVFLTGDFNEPSHLDWTAEAAEAGLHMGMAVDWPTSRAIVRHGFRDAFRAVHPDEVEHPGTTWTPLRGDADEVHDRIDMVYVAGDHVDVLDAYTMGPRPEPPTDRAVSGYPSDHRSVVVTIGLGPSGDASSE
jgi:exonuclease III